MRRAGSISVALTLVACTSKSSPRSLHERCAEAKAHPEKLANPAMLARYAHSCAGDEPEGACRDALRSLDDDTSPQVEAMVRTVCFGEAPSDAGIPAPAGPATLQLHEAEAELTWHGLDLHLGKDCPTLGVALDTAGVHDELTLKVDKDVVYSEVLAVMDCVKTHVPKISLEEVP